MDFFLCLEAFVVCLDYKPPEGFDPNLLTPFLDFSYYDTSNLSGVNKKIIPFIVSGDMDGFDSDTTYPLKVSDLFIYKKIVKI